MRPRTVPMSSTVSLTLSCPRVGETKVELPPIDNPLRFWKLGADTSAATPTTSRFGSM